MAHDFGYRSADFVIGDHVIYYAPHQQSLEAGEEGIVTSINTDFVFVRYTGDIHAKATLPQALIPAEEREE